MAEPDEILIRIALSGEDDVIAALGSIGIAGEGAFAKLESALGDAGAVFAGLTAAIAGVGAGLFQLAEHSANSAKQLQNLALTSGDTIENLSATQGALASMGLNTDTLGQAFRRMAITVERSWDEIAKAVKDRSNQVIDDNFAVADSSNAVVKAQEGIRDAQLAASSAHLSVRAAQNSLDRALLARQGLTQDPQVALQQAVEEAYQRVAEAKQHQLEADNRLRESSLALAEAEQKAAEAAKKRHEDDMNDTAAVAAAVDKVASGYATLQEVRSSANLNVDNLIKGIVASASGAESAIKNFNGDIASLADMSPTVAKTFNTVANFMKNSNDAALNTALSFRLFGRNATELTAILTQLGGDGMQKLAQHFKDLGFATTDADKDFIVTISTIRFELTALKDQLGQTFVSSFTDGMKMFQGSIEANRASIVEWAQELANNVKPVILDFFAIISGERATNTTWMQPLADGLKVIGRFALEAGKDLGAMFIGLTGGDQSSVADEQLKKWVKFGEGVRKAIELVISIVEALYNKLQDLVGKINEVFGTSFSAGEIVAIAVIGRVAGAFGLLGLAVKSVSALIRLLFSDAIGGGVVVAARTAGVAAGGSLGTGILSGLSAVLAPGVILPIIAAAIAGFGLNKLYEKSVEENKKIPGNFGDNTTGMPSYDPFGTHFRAPGNGDQTVKPTVEENTEAIKANTEALKTRSQTASMDVQRGSTTTHYDNMYKEGANYRPDSGAYSVINRTSNSPGVEVPREAYQQEALDLIARLIPDGLAGGGMVIGPGTSTSDSVNAKLSNREYVVNAQATSHYGSSFMDAVNSMKLPKFKWGGMFGKPLIPSFAGGGMFNDIPDRSSGGNPMTLVLDGHRFDGMTASDDAASSLTKYATERRMRSGGKKPSHY